jgi:hypothetical protein
VQCKAKTQRGTPCKAQALAGGRVCRVHGGAAPQVIAAARQRLLMASDPVAARLIQIARSTKTEDRDAIVAIREILNRAGVSATPTSDAGANGQVLWDEFVTIHRRRVGEESA